MINLRFVPLIFLFFVGCAQNQAVSKPAAATAATPSRSLPKVRTTAYCHLEDGVRRNAVGRKLANEKYYSASADWSRYPLGTVFRVAETGRIHVVDDYGPALVGTDTIDLYVPTLAEMNHWGVRTVRIDILEEGSYANSLHTLTPRGHRGYIRKMVQALKPKVS